MSSYADIKIILKMDGESIEFDNNKLTAFEIVKTFNDHAQISFSGEVTANQNQYFKMAAYEVIIEAYLNPANTLIFNGVLTHIEARINYEERIVQVEITGKSLTHYLDTIMNNRAFQDQNMTYQAMVDKVTSVYTKAMGEALTNADQPIQTFTLQYQETDWQFLKRMASRLHTGLVPEVTRENLKFYFGMPELKERGVLKEIAACYGIRKRLHDYRQLLASGVVDIGEDDFLTYHFKTDELFNIGDYVYLYPDNKNSKLYVYEATMILEGSLFRCYCKVSPLYGLKQKKIDNLKITGVSLEGKVVEVGGQDDSQDYLRVYLPGIDIPVDKAKACWFRYVTPYAAAGNTGWYWMPEENDAVLLYFPTCQEEQAMVTTAVRRQESESERLQDPNVAYLRTKFENELMFKEGQMTLSGKDEGLHIHLDQKKGVIIESPTMLTIQADNNLTLKAGRNLVISAQDSQSEIQLNFKDGKTNNLVLDGDGGIRFKGKVDKGVGSGEMLALETNLNDNNSSDTREEKPEPSKYDSKSGNEKIAAAYTASKKLVNPTHEQLKTLAKNHQLTDAEFLYLCARYAFDIKRFDKKLIKTKTGEKWETYCNQYSGYVFYLYTGSTQLINKGGKSLIQTLTVNGQKTVVTDSKSGWNNVSNGKTAQDLANRGKFVVAITTDPNHIAVIMPGQLVMGYGKHCSPAIAQQGSNKLLYGITFNKKGVNTGTLNYGWGSKDIGKVEYYGFSINDQK